MTSLVNQLYNEGNSTFTKSQINEIIRISKIVFEQESEPLVNRLDFMETILDAIVNWSETIETLVRTIIENIKNFCYTFG